METPQVSSMAVEKRFLSANKLTLLSRRVGKIVFNSGFRPDFMIGIARGGYYPATCVQEHLQRKQGCLIPLVSIRTSSREDLTGLQKSLVNVHATGHARALMHRDTKVLIVDDVFDSGRTIKAVLEFFKDRLGLDCPAQMKVATVFNKPKRKAVDIDPDFYAEVTDEWLVFPHEQAGLTKEERRKQKRILQEGDTPAAALKDDSITSAELLDIFDCKTQAEKDASARTLVTLFMDGLPIDAEAEFEHAYKYCIDYQFSFKGVRYDIRGSDPYGDRLYKFELEKTFPLMELAFDWGLADGAFGDVLRAIRGGLPWRELAEAALKATEGGKE